MVRGINDSLDLFFFFFPNKGEQQHRADGSSLKEVAILFVLLHSPL